MATLLGIAIAGVLVAAQTHDEVAAKTPLITFDWGHPSSDAILVYSPWSAWSSNVSAVENLYGNAIGLNAELSTSTPGANVSVSWWGADIYIYGTKDPGTAYKLFMDGEEHQRWTSNDAVHQLAYTAGYISKGYHTASLVLTSGRVGITSVTLRNYVFMSGVPAVNISGTDMIKGGSYSIEQHAQMCTTDATANPFFARTGDWSVQSPTPGLWNAPYLSSSTPGDRLSFTVPPNTTWLRLNGTPTVDEALYAVSLSPSPIDGAPSTATFSPQRAMDDKAVYADGIGYFQLPLDPTTEYTVSLEVVKGSVGLYGATFFSSAYNNTVRREDAGGIGAPAATGSANAPAGVASSSAAGSTGAGSASGADSRNSNSGNGNGTNNNGTSGTPETPKLTPTGAIAGGTVGGVAVLSFVVVFFWWKKRPQDRRRKRPHSGAEFVVDEELDPAISPFPVPEKEIPDFTKPTPSALVRSNDSPQQASPATPATPATPADYVLSPAVGRSDPSPTPPTPVSGAVVADPPASSRSSPGGRKQSASSSPTTLPPTTLSPTNLLSPATRRSPRTPRSPTSPHAPDLQSQPWLSSEGGVHQDADAGRIVAIVPPRYDPAWMDEPDPVQGHRRA